MMKWGKRLKYLYRINYGRKKYNNKIKQNYITDQHSAENIFRHFMDYVHYAVVAV